MVTSTSVNEAVPALAYVAATLAGLGAGVAVNLAADTVEGDEESPWRARACRKCRAPLPPERLVPVLNLSAARRTCPQCGTRASVRRPLLELALALIFPLLLAHVTAPEHVARLAPLAVFAVDVIGCVVLALIFAVDLEHRLIFDFAIYPPAVALIAVALLFDHKSLAAMLFGVVLCGGLFLLLYGLGFLLYRQEALGFGDVKLAALIGLLVGWPGAMTALVLAGLLGAAVSVLLLGLGVATRRTFIPFGIFLAVGAVLALLLTPPFW